MSSNSDEKMKEGEFVKLGSFDFFRNLESVYFFRDKIDLERLTSSLERLVEIIPVLSSVPEKMEDGNYLRIVKPSNVKIVSKYVDEDISKLYLPNEDGLIDSNDRVKLYEIAELVETNANPMEPVVGAPIAKVTLVETITKQHVLFLSLLHVLDGHSKNEIMSLWSDLYDGKKLLPSKTSFTTDRNLLNMPDPNFNVYEHPIERFRHLESYRPDSKVEEGETGGRYLPIEKVVVRAIHFTEEKLEKMKKLVREELVETEIPKFSTNDCICAFLWKLHAVTISNTVKSGKIPLQLIADYRSRYSKIDSSYLGNAIMFPNVDLYLDILKLPFSTLVLKIRELVNNLNDEVVETHINTLGYLQKQGLKEMGMYIHTRSRKSILLLNDWRDNWKRRPNFGDAENNCVREVMTTGSLSMCVPSYWHVVVGENGRGLDAITRFEMDVYEKMKGYDLSSFETLKMLEEKVFCK